MNIMYNLLKFKFNFVFILVSVFLIGLFPLTSIASAYTYSSVLQLGSSGSQVVSLQERLGVNPTTGNFDYTTRGAVVNFQLSKGFKADGIVGPITGRALSYVPPAPTPAPIVVVPVVVPTPSVNVPSQSNQNSIYPLGCSSSLGFSMSTGKSCSNTAPLPLGCTSMSYSDFSSVTGLPCVDRSTYREGCNSANGYSITSGLSCSIPIGCTSQDGYSIATGLSCDNPGLYTPLPVGCTSRSGYSATTGSSCLTGQKITPLVGTDGWLNHFNKAQGYTSTKSIYGNRLNSTLAGYVLSGEKYSDIRIVSMNISLQLTEGTASIALNRYIKNLYITENGTKVGTLTADDFSRSGSMYSAIIPLTNAVVRSDQNTYFYITADTIEHIDSSNVDNTWTAMVNEIRYTNGANYTSVASSIGDIGINSSINFHFVPTP